MTQRQQTLIGPTKTPRAQEAEGEIQQLTPKLKNNTQGLGEQMQYSNEVTQCIQICVSPTLKYQFSETHGKQYQALVFEGEVAVKLHVKDVEVVTGLDRNPRQDQVTMGELTILDLLTIKGLVLLGFS